MLFKNHPTMSLEDIVIFNEVTNKEIGKFYEAKFKIKIDGMDSIPDDIKTEIQANSGLNVVDDVVIFVYDNRVIFTIKQDPDDKGRLMISKNTSYADADADCDRENCRAKAAAKQTHPASTTKH